MDLFRLIILKNKKLIDSQLKINKLKKIIKVSETKLIALRKKERLLKKKIKKPRIVF